MKLDPIGVLFSNAWRRLRERFAVVALIFLVPLVLVDIGQLLLFKGGASAVTLGVIIRILSDVVSVFSTLALISAFGKGTDFGASYQAGIKLFWAWIWLAILAGLAVVGGLVMLIIPGIMLAVQLSFASYAFVLEGKRGMAALTQSREYIKGYWWAFFGRNLLLILCLAAAMAILFAPATLLLGPIGGGIMYGAILLVFVPFSVAYQYEIYENLRRLKPDASQAAAKADPAFLKVATVVGIVGAAVLFVGLIAAAIFLPADFANWKTMQPGNYGYPSATGTSTLPDEGYGQISPTSGPVGTMVTISGIDPSSLAAANTILMNNLVAARDVAPATGGSLTFTVPASLAPDCDPSGPCPQFLMHVASGVGYNVAVENASGTFPVGLFTVTGTASDGAPAGSQ
jgi:hypothetical protein